MSRFLLVCIGVGYHPLRYEGASYVQVHTCCCTKRTVIEPIEPSMGGVRYLPSPNAVPRRVNYTLNAVFVSLLFVFAVWFRCFFFSRMLRAFQERQVVVGSVFFDHSRTAAVCLSSQYSGFDTSTVVVRCDSYSCRTERRLQRIAGG